MNSSLFMVGELGFLKSHRIGDQEWRGHSSYRGTVYKRGKNCFSLIMYRFCSINTPYTANPSFRMFVFIMTPFDT